MDFIFTGFEQDNNVRKFVFEGVAEDRTRTRFTVGADLQLTRKYDISVQELPLLCRRLLEGLPAGEQLRTLTFSEDEMVVFAKARAAAKDEAAQKRKPHRKPNTSTIGRAWRSPNVQA